MYIPFAAAGALILLFFVILAFSSIREHKPRATLLSLLTAASVTAAWFGWLLYYDPGDLQLTIPVVMILMIVLCYFMPLGGKKILRIGESSERVDERDTMFARDEYVPGTEKFEKYYAMRPENREIDDKMRRFPPLLEPGGRYYDRYRSGYIVSLFKFEERLVSQADGPVSSTRENVESVSISRKLKDYALHLGADEVGIARLNPRYVYSHVGRGPGQWGKAIENRHPYAIAYSVEMAYEKVEEAPGIGISEETALQYLNTQMISISLAQYIRDLGYSARAHIPGSDYQIMLPPVAYDAGIGELGRLGYIISPKFGARIRLGAVTTDIPLIEDAPVQFGVQDFCEKCRKCAVNCPSGSIPFGDKTIDRGVEKWQMQMEKCFHYWRHIGTDCGLCMRVCPFSHPTTLIHNIVRRGIKHSSFARTVSVYGDDFFYGKKVSFPRFPEENKQ
ncbi:reductive dehalogenase [candidate division KSB1 bacterium]